MTIDTATLEALAAKLDALDLSGDERQVLLTVLGAGCQALAEAEVEGFASGYQLGSSFFDVLSKVDVRGWDPARKA